MENIFTLEDQQELHRFVNSYESYNKDITLLEEDIKVLLDKQEDIVKSIVETRQNEELFFIALSERTSKHPSELKNLAKAFISANSFVLDAKKV